MRKLTTSVLLMASLASTSLAPRAHAVSREIIQLQTQVQGLQDMLQHMQQSNDERMGVLQHLVEQTADNVNRMSTDMTSLERAVKAENDATSAKVDGVSGQVQSLNDSVDELKNRLAGVNKSLQDVQAQLQNAQQAPGVGQPAAGGPLGPGPLTQGPAPAAAPPVRDLYQGGVRDYNSASYAVAASEFGDLMKYYPQDDLAGNAQFYLAEIAYRQGKYPDAIKGYDAVLEQYPGNVKAPAAQLRKGESLMALNQKDAGARELRSLIQRYPQTPEAQQARSRLNALGIRINPAKPSAYAR